MNENYKTGSTSGSHYPIQSSTLSHGSLFQLSHMHNIHCHYLYTIHYSIHYALYWSTPIVIPSNHSIHCLPERIIIIISEWYCTHGVLYTQGNHPWARLGHALERYPLQENVKTGKFNLFGFVFVANVDNSCFLLVVLQTVGNIYKVAGR